MSAGQLAALVSAITALVGAVGAVVAMFRHVNGPSHNGKP